MTYLSTPLFTNSFASTTSAKAERTPKLLDESDDASTSQQQTDDVVTLSAKGLEAYNKIASVKIYQPQEQLDVPLVDKPHTLEFAPDYEKKHSKHLSLSAWVLGINTQGMGISEISTLMRYDQKILGKSQAMSQAAMEKIDEKIDEILKSNNIVLSSGEMLDLSVDRNGMSQLTTKKLAKQDVLKSKTYSTMTKRLVKSYSPHTFYVKSLNPCAEYRPLCRQFVKQTQFW